MGGENVNTEKIMGVLFIILGLLLVFYPIVSSAFLSILIGFSLVCFGMSALGMGIVFSESPVFRYSSIMIGIISLIFGIIFMFFLNALPFLFSLQFFIIGFLMMFYGILGIAYLAGAAYKLLSVTGLILGIVIVALTLFLASQPIIIAVIIGAFLIIDGVCLLVVGSSESLIEKYE